MWLACPLLVPDVLDVCSDVPGTVSGSLHLRLQLINVLIVLTEGSADGILWGGEDERV